MTRDSKALDDELSRPTPALLQDLAQVPGDLVVLGAGGEMGTSLARMAARAVGQAELSRRVIAVARFSEPGVREQLQHAGVETIECDLFDRKRVAQLPEASSVISMVGQKFGTTDDAGRTWAVNTYLPAVIAERYPDARLVAFSTGNVYPLSPGTGEGPSEADPTGPIGEYAQSALGRERMLEFFSSRNRTAMAILRLNYAVEPRYGVLRDIADQVRAGQPVDVTMGWVNLIWQRDANEIALRALTRCQVPPLILNLTGRPKLSVRWLAQQFARRWDMDARFRGEESATALLSNAARMETLFGPPPMGIEQMIDQVATWVEQGGESLRKPTHFEMREGKF